MSSRWTLTSTAVCTFVLSALSCPLGVSQAHAQSHQDPQALSSAAVLRTDAPAAITAAPTPPKIVVVPQEPGRTPCLIQPATPIDLSSLNDAHVLASLILARDSTPNPTPATQSVTIANAAKYFSALPGAPNALSGLMDTPIPSNPHHSAADMKLTELFPDSKKTVTVMSTSTTNDESLETIGQGTVSVNGLLDLSGSADITTVEIAAKGTADLQVFRIPLSKSATLVGLARTQLYVKRSADFCLSCAGEWDMEAFSPGVGVGLELPGLIPHHPTVISVGGGPMLEWGATAADHDPMTPAISGTVLGALSVLAF